MRRGTNVLWLLLVFFPGIAAAAPYALPSVFLEELTSPEVADARSHGVTTILVPTGGTEQNGPHLALGKHNAIMRYTSERIAKQLGNALVAPLIAYVPEGGISPPQGHMRFAGTISLSEDTFAHVLEDGARSFKQHGFTRICFIGEHGASQAVQARVAESLSREWKADGVKVLHVAEYYSAANGQKAWLKTHGEPENSSDAHAGISDSSELLAAHPRLVRKNLLIKSSCADEKIQGCKTDPSHASLAYGKQMLTLKIQAATQAVREAQDYK